MSYHFNPYYILLLKLLFLNNWLFLGKLLKKHRFNQNFMRDLYLYTSLRLLQEIKVKTSSDEAQKHENVVLRILITAKSLAALQISFISLKNISLRSSNNFFTWASLKETNYFRNQFFLMSTQMVSGNIYNVPFSLCWAYYYGLESNFTNKWLTILKLILNKNQQTDFQSPQYNFRIVIKINILK